MKVYSLLVASVVILMAGCATNSTEPNNINTGTGDTNQANDTVREPTVGDVKAQIKARNEGLNAGEGEGKVESNGDGE